MAISAATLMGHPSNFKQICKVYPPTLTEVLSNENYGKYVAILTVSQEDIWDELAKREGEIPTECITPFDYLLTQCTNKELLSLTEEAFYFFTKEKVNIRPEGKIIIFLDGLDKIKQVSDFRIIDEENYFDFQNLIRTMICEKVKEPPMIDDDPYVSIIKAKGRRRDRTVKKKGNQSAISFSTMLVALSCMNVGFSLLKECGEISYPAIFPLFKMAQDKEKHGVDMQLLANGADAKKVKPKYWVKNLD